MICILTPPNFSEWDLVLDFARNRRVRTDVIFQQPFLKLEATKDIHSKGGTDSQK